MKKRTKGIIVSAFFGFILLTSTVMIAIPAIMPEDPNEVMTETGTPMDNYPDVQREQFCGSNEFAQSNSYVTEYKIPTPCTQPLAISTDPSGNAWFVQTNTGAVAKIKLAKDRLRKLGYVYPVVGFSYDSNTKGAHLIQYAKHSLQDKHILVYVIDPLLVN